MEIKVPTLAESISLARILKWHAQPGDEVPRGSNLVDIETDKVTLEVPAPEDGTLQEILAPEGTDVTTDQVIATFGNDMEGAETLVAEPAQQPEEPPAEEPQAAAQETDTQATGAATGPAVRALLQKYGIDPNDITGSGAQGRILPEDIRAWIGAKKESQAQQAAPAPQPAAAPEPPAPEPQPAPAPEPPAPEPQPAPAPPAPQASDGERTERREPLSPLRQSIAKRLLSAQHDNALLSTFNEVDMSAVMALRKKHGESFRENHGVKLGYMSFFVRAAIAALRRFPSVGASIDGNNIVYHDYHDISIAVGSPRGLVVPVIRNADKCSMADLERTISDFGARAAAATLTMDEMLGGTFTITNGGIFGSLLSTPIVNPPQSAILGMHKIQQRPVVDEAGEIVAKPMMYIALTYDHRIIDGREAVQFLVTIKEHIEEPLCLLLDA